MFTPTSGGENDFFETTDWQSLFDFDGTANRPQKLGDLSTFTLVCLQKSRYFSYLYMSRGFETQACILIMLQKTAQGPPLQMSVIYVRFYQGVLAPESH